MKIAFGVGCDYIKIYETMFFVTHPSDEQDEQTINEIK